jgi:hypothetical protein
LDTVAQRDQPVDERYEVGIARNDDKFLLGRAEHGAFVGVHRQLAIHCLFHPTFPSRVVRHVNWTEPKAIERLVLVAVRGAGSVEKVEEISPTSIEMFDQKMGEWTNSRL